MGPGGFGQGQFGPQGGGQTETPPHYIYVCLEVRSKVQVLPQRPVFEFDHRFGRKGRFLFQELVKDMVEYTHVEHPSNLREFNKKYAGVVQEAKDATGCYLAASYALSHGLTKEFHNAMAALIKADPKHYAAVNYQRVAAELKKAPSGEDRATQALINELKADGGYKSVTSDAGHYVLLTRNDGPLFQSANKRRLARLEEALENFFYWFALQENGPQPTIPNYRLYAVLVDDRQSFFDRHLAWGGQPMVADSFTPRRDSLIVLSAKRLDDDFTLFDKKMQELTQRIVATTKIGRDEFISGAIWDRKETAGAVEPLAAVQTLLLIHKAMEDEAERAAISHEATRQLLFASGLLPRMVHVPEWIQTGLASYFDTPYGALFSGVGLPSWSHLIAFNYYRKDKERLGVSFEALMRTISDRYFRDLRMAEDDQRQVANNKEKQDDKGDAAKVQREVAQSSAWALTYYLLYNKKLPQLMRYLDEIAHLPRDLEIDDKVLQSCFGRAFDLMDRSNPRQLDLDRVRLFARDWYSFMDGVHLKVQAAEDYYRLVRYTPRKKATNQFNQPGLGAGGFAPPGGIGPGGIAPPGVGNPGNLPPPGGAAPGALPPPGGLAPPGGLLKPGGGER
ncbi:MAG: DUF1570 domain-containing protein [Gemmataceae bacterium]|nr:DUF1570 domain-containing protein [Gemmataceae bacterium]